MSGCEENSLRISFSLVQRNRCSFPESSAVIMSISTLSEERTTEGICFIYRCRSGPIEIMEQNKCPLGIGRISQLEKSPSRRRRRRRDLTLQWTSKSHGHSLKRHLDDRPLAP
ncbi:hypothetical protein CEXT_40741 [Caerostris extrusa]|uniref:Uncharacterized protein n=1 Tax=Caerostris extrusa TaxID=172846 RepID=A0AAV4VZK5_CAEEX|nr:hypothetical protein CEXT_40741 [Caerostris extrusa]